MSAGGLDGRKSVGISLLAGAAHLVVYSDPNYMLDDAWISLRAARNWVELGLPTFNREGPPVEAMTNLGFTGLLALLGHPDWTPLAARLLGAAGWLGALGLASATAQALAGPRAALVAGLALALCPSLAFHGFSGLETGLWCAVATGALALILLGPATMRRALGLGALLGLGFTLRPEVALYGPALVLLAATQDRRWAWALLPLGAAGAGVEAWRWHTFGALVPNTFYAKPGDAREGLVYLERLLRSTGLAAPVGLALALTEARWRRVGAWGALVLGAVLATGGDWMDGFRRLSELGVLLAVVLGVTAFHDSPGRRRLARLALLTWGLSSAGAAWTHSDDRRTNTEGHQRLATLAQTAGLRGVALADIGIFGWIYQGEILDAGGLADPVIARAEGHHGQKWSEARLLELAPDAVIVNADTAGGGLALSGPDLPMLRSALSSGRYRVHRGYPNGRWMLILLVREDLTLDPALWGAALPDSATETLRATALGEVPEP